MNIASLSLALSLATATLVSAQATTTPAPATGDGGTPASQTVARPELRAHRHHHGLFRGVKLSADQKTKLASIRDQYRGQAKPLFEQARAARAEYRSAKAKNDSAGMTAARNKLQDVRSQMTTLRQRWMSDARGVLTPDQQARFDKNVADRKAAWQKHHSDRATS